MQATLARIHEQFFKQISLWARETSQIQSGLLELYELKKQHLIVGRFEALSGTIQQEQGLLQRYHHQQQQRERILELLKQMDPKVQTLTGWLAGFADEDARQLRRELKAVQNANERLRQHSWAMWIFANRSEHHYSQLVELIAYAGKKPPTYDEDFSPRVSSSTFLDASA